MQKLFKFLFFSVRANNIVKLIFTGLKRPVLMQKWGRSIDMAIGQVDTSYFSQQYRTADFSIANSFILSRLVMFDMLNLIMCRPNSISRRISISEMVPVPEMRSVVALSKNNASMNYRPRSVFCNSSLREGKILNLFQV